MNVNSVFLESARGIDDVGTIQDIGRRGMRGAGVANGATSTPASDRFRRRRAENAKSIRDDLLAAAAAVVGKYGYANTSITRVTKLAGVASGTFYLYFPSRQALLDQILPESVLGWSIIFVRIRIRPPPG